MDLDGRVELSRPARYLRDTGNSRPRQYSWATKRCGELGRRVGKYVALRWTHLHHDRVNDEFQHSQSPQRPMEIQRRRMDVDGRVEHRRTIGTYGTHGTAAPGNIPGGRFHAVRWTDSSGNLWLFGGDALDSNGTKSYLNDLWKYSAGQWTWMGGSSIALQPGIYGTQGTATAANVPGGREQSFSWTDASGNFWLFGGDGYDSQGNHGSSMTSGNTVLANGPGWRVEPDQPVRNLRNPGNRCARQYSQCEK
jgi:hypothetical protein